MKRFLEAALLLLPLPLLALPDAEPSPDLGGVPPGMDPENPDFSGMVDFSSATPGPDGSWCITKVKYVDHMEQDQVKECWHQNVTQCHDTYITEFLPSQEQKCEESFWKSCKIDFKETPFNYTLKQCHTPLIKECNDYPQEYGAPQKTVCRTWFESECNTTYVEAGSGDLKPNTWCQKMPRKICAPDNCNMVQGPEDCRDKMMVSTIQKPEEHCELQPQRHCRLITKLVPHLTTKEVCNTVPKEICMLKLVNPHPVKKPIQLKWCTKKKPSAQSYGAPQPDEYGAPRPAPSGYLPAAAPQQFQQQQFQPQQFRPQGRSGAGTQEDPYVVDSEQFQQLQVPPSNIIDFSGGQREQFRRVRQQPQESHRTEITIHGDVPGEARRMEEEARRNEELREEARREEVQFHRPSGHPPHKRHTVSGQDLYTGASQIKVHVVKPQPGSNNAHRVELPFEKEIFKQPSENRLVPSLSMTLAPKTLAKKSLEQTESLSSPPPPLPTAYIPSISSFAPPPHHSMSQFSPPPKLPTTTWEPTTSWGPTTSWESTPTARPTSTPPTTNPPSPRPTTPSKRGQRRQRQFFQPSTSRTVSSSLRNQPGSIF